MSIPKFVLAQSAPPDCSAPYFSEILISKDLINNNYAIEIYNPTNSLINLIDYEIRLESSTNTLGIYIVKLSSSGHQLINKFVKK